MEFHRAYSRFELQVLVMGQLVRELDMTPADLEDPAELRALAQCAANIIVAAVDWSAAKDKEAQGRA